MNIVEIRKTNKNEVWRWIGARRQLCDVNVSLIRPHWSAALNGRKHHFGLFNSILIIRRTKTSFIRKPQNKQIFIYFWFKKWSHSLVGRETLAFRFVGFGKCSFLEIGRTARRHPLRNCSDQKWIWLISIQPNRTQSTEFRPSKGKFENWKNAINWIANRILGKGYHPLEYFSHFFFRFQSSSERSWIIQLWATKQNKTKQIIQMEWRQS